MDTSNPEFEATVRYRAGVDPQVIIDGMVADGFERDVATLAVTRTHQRRQWDGSAGARDLAIGGGICAIGILVTAGSYAAASDGGGYFLAWGAIVFGGFQALRGLVTILGKK